MHLIYITITLSKHYDLDKVFKLFRKVYKVSVIWVISINKYIWLFIMITMYYL